jgi:hypothetical protein
VDSGATRTLNRSVGVAARGVSRLPCCALSRHRVRYWPLSIAGGGLRRIASGRPEPWAAAFLLRLNLDAGFTHLEAHPIPPVRSGRTPRPPTQIHEPRRRPGESIGGKPAQELRWEQRTALGASPIPGHVSGRAFFDPSRQEPTFKEKFLARL